MEREPRTGFNAHADRMREADADRARGAAINDRREAIEARAVSEEVRRLNDEAEFFFNGSGTRTLTDPETGEVVASPESPRPSVFDSMLEDDDISSDDYERYVDRYNELTERGDLELSQVKMILDMEDPIKRRRIVNKMDKAQMMAGRSATEARAFVDGRIESLEARRLNLIVENGVFTEEDYAAAKRGEDLYSSTTGAEVAEEADVDHEEEPTGVEDGEAIEAEEPVYGPHLHERIDGEPEEDPTLIGLPRERDWDGYDGDEEPVYGPHLHERIDGEGGTEVMRAISPEEAEAHRVYTEARSAYINASAAARGSVLNSMLSNPMIRRFGWVDRLARRDTENNEFEEASRAFKALFREQRDSLIADYQGRNPDATEHQVQVGWAAEQIGRLEQEISDAQSALDGSRSRWSRWGRRVAGLAVAAGAGAAAKFMEGQSDGSNIYYLIAGMTVGAAAGIIAEKGAWNNNTESDISSRMTQAANDYFDESLGGGGSDVVGAIDRVTEDVQAKKARRIGFMALAGAGATAGTYMYAPDVFAPGNGESGDIVPVGTGIEALDMTFDIEYGHGVTQELAQTFEAAGLPVPPQAELFDLYSEGIDRFGPSGIYQGITLELSPDGSEYWVPKPVKGVSYTPQYAQFLFESQMGN